MATKFMTAVVAPINLSTRAEAAKRASTVDEATREFLDKLEKISKARARRSESETHRRGDGSKQMSTFAERLAALEKDTKRRAAKADDEEIPFGELLKCLAEIAQDEEQSGDDRAKARDTIAKLTKRAGAEGLAAKDVLSNITKKESMRARMGQPSLFTKTSPHWQGGRYVFPTRGGR
jgi:hypothetical protein